MAEIPVDWGVLMLNHPSYLDIGNKVKGIPKGWETCCIQISFALNKSGAPIRNKGGMGGLQKGVKNLFFACSRCETIWTKNSEKRRTMWAERGLPRFRRSSI